MRPQDDAAARGAALPLLPMAAALALFLIAGTLNSAGYRYGASDQAFYVPAVIHHLQPDLYPRDQWVIGSQARLTLSDEMVAAVGRATGLSLQTLFVVLYALTLLLIATAAADIGRRYFRSPWTTMALLAALTLKHAIAKSGTNTLEGYFHPRQLAFGFGAWAVAAFLRGRAAAAALLVFVAACVHPTTAMWFVMWLAAAGLVTTGRRVKVVWLAAGAAAAAFAAWMVAAGPLAGRLATMDAEWLATLESKTYLFPLEWPASIWLLNLSYPVLILWLLHRRRTAGLAGTRETALAVGCVALTIVFLAALPFNAARVQLAVQLQPARVFWMLDFLATVYVVWALAEGVQLRVPRARLVAATVIAITVARGVYIGWVEFPDRPMFARGIPDSDWGRVMAWARQSPRNSYWLADPSHSVMYGTSVRVTGERDVFVEAVKDAAIGMYDREVAMRTRDRVAAIGDFRALTPERARALAQTYGLDYLVTDAAIDLPVRFASGALHVYALR